MNAIYLKKLALDGACGISSWRYPPLLSGIETGRVDVWHSLWRGWWLCRLPVQSGGLFNAPMPPGVAVITDFAR